MSPHSRVIFGSSRSLGTRLSNATLSEIAPHPSPGTARSGAGLSLKGRGGPERLPLPAAGEAGPVLPALSEGEGSRGRVRGAAVFAGAAS